MQTDAIRDYVLPLIEVGVDEAGAGVTLRQLVGHAFLIGRRSFAITAAHVVAVPRRIAVAFVTPDGWFAHSVTEIETHPIQDVAVLRVKTENLKSICRVVDTRENSGMKYIQFAYPDEVMFELPHDERTNGRPDLVVSGGLHSTTYESRNPIDPRSIAVRSQRSGGQRLFWKPYDPSIATRRRRRLERCWRLRWRKGE